MNNDYNLDNQKEQNTFSNNENVNMPINNMPSTPNVEESNIIKNPNTMPNPVYNENDKEDDITDYAGIVIILFCILGLVLFVFGNIIGLGIGIISLLLSILQIKKSPPFLSVAFLLSIILCGLYIVGNLLVTKENDEYLYRTRSIEYVNMARSYIESARGYVKLKNTIGCKSDSTQQEKIKIKSLESVFDGNSPFKNKIDEENSFVLVQATQVSNNCQISYAIYITDGKYSIGKEDKPLKYEEIDVSSIEKEV